MRLPLAAAALILIMPLSAQESREDWEPFFRNGELAEEQLSDGSGRPLALRIYRGGELQETRTYQYGENRITVQVTARMAGGDGKSWQDVLYLREDGSLRMLERSGGETEVQTGRSPRTGWTRTAEGQEIYVYGLSGEIRERSLYEGETLREEEDYSYDGEGRLLSSELLRPGKGERELTLYTAGGQAGEVRLYRKDLLVSQTTNRYDDESRLVGEEIRGGGVHSERTLAYDGEGALKEELIYRNGLLAKKIYYEGEERTEELYSRGTLTLTVRYRGSEIIGEEKKK